MFNQAVLCPGEQALTVPEQLNKILQTVHAGNFMGHVSEPNDFSASWNPVINIEAEQFGLTDGRIHHPQWQWTIIRSHDGPRIPER